MPVPSNVLSTLTAADAAGLESTLTRLADGVADTLGPSLVGVYLVGSFALGAGDDQSDVDFAVLISEPVTSTQLEALQRLHRALPDLGTHGADHLEGSYIVASDLAGPSRHPWFYVDNGSRTLEQSDHDDSCAFRWVFREHGVALVGPAADTLLPPVDGEALRDESRARARQWRDLLHSDPAIVGDSWAQTHFVTGLCRLLYTSSVGAITSKSAATAWAEERLGPHWGPLLQHARHARAGTWDRVGKPADAALAAATIALSAEVCRRFPTH